MAKHDDILEQAKERFDLVIEYDQDERELADDDIRFATNDEDCQWPSELKKEREDDDRPCLVINKIPEKIDQVDGEFKQMQPSFKVRAIDSQADPQVAEVYSGLLRHIEYNSNARTAYNSSHTSTLHCGRGAWRIDVVDAKDDPFVRDLEINRIPNVLTVYWDPYSKKADKSDANYIFVTELVDKKEFEKDHQDIADQWPDDNSWTNWRVGSSYRIAEYWWKERVSQTYYRVKTVENGIESEKTVTEIGLFDQVVDQKQAKKTVVKWCKMAAKKVIEGPHDWPTDDIPIIIEIGKEINIRGKNKSRGMVRHAKDGQRLYNYTTSSVTEQNSLAPKTPYIGTAAMFEPYIDLWQQAHKKNYSVLPFELDERAPGMKPYREPPPQISSAYQYEFMRLEHDIMSAMGIYAASLGDEGQEVSGRAIMARQRQGNIGSYPYTDSFNIAYTYSCKQIIKLIPHVYDTERVVRIVGSDGQEDMVPINARPQLPEIQKVPQNLQGQPKPPVTELFNDLTVGKYDIAVTIGPSYTTQREETLAILMDMVKTAPMIAQSVMDLIAANMDIPKHSEELVKRLKKMVPVGIRDLEPGEEPPQQQPDPQMMLEMAKLQLENEIKTQELQIKEFQAQTKAIADMVTAESKEMGNQVSQMLSMVEQIRKNTEQQHNIQMQAAQAQHGMETKNRELDLQEQEINLPVGNTGQESA